MPGGLHARSKETATDADRFDLGRGADAFVASILDSVAQPVLVADRDGLIRFANPAALAALGYDHAAALVGKPGHQMLHDEHPHDPAGECPLLPRTTGEPVHRDDDWFVRRDGSAFRVEYWSAPAGRDVVISFQDIGERQRAQQELQRLADEQAALRDVATLVARGADPRDVFDAVCEVTGRLIGAASVNLAQFTPDETNLTQAGWSERGTHIPPGTRLPLDGDSINALIRRTHAPVRVDSYEGRSGRLAARLRELGIRSEVGAPVIVDGAVWGALIAGTDHAEPMPPGTERRVASFAELIGTAVSNATARSELIDSRARIVTTFDAARQRVTRDLHDGAQQLLVSTIIDLQLAQQNWSSAPQQAKECLDRALDEARDSIASLREIAAGIHPAILTHRGLSAALDALAERLPVPVHLDVTDDRFPPPVEASIYFFCSEALTNVVKHARASAAWVRVAPEGDRCAIEVRDDGVGSAEPRLGTSGLIGLRDRVGALKGTMHISSPPSAGTRLRAWIPLGAGQRDVSAGSGASAGSE